MVFQWDVSRNSSSLDVEARDVPVHAFVARTIIKLHLLSHPTCMQGLMSAAISASRPALAASLRTVLSELHGAKKMGVAAGSVDSMLVRLYEPILFRGLSAANPAVRRNALELLFEAFPLAVSTWEGHVAECMSQHPIDTLSSMLYAAVYAFICSNAGLLLLLCACLFEVKLRLAVRNETAFSRLK